MSQRLLNPSFISSMQTVFVVSLQDNQYSGGYKSMENWIIIIQLITWGSKSPVDGQRIWFARTPNAMWLSTNVRYFLDLFSSENHTIDWSLFEDHHDRTLIRKIPTEKHCLCLRCEGSVHRKFTSVTVNSCYCFSSKKYTYWTNWYESSNLASQSVV